MTPIYEPLANWIDSTYEVATVNIIHDYIDDHVKGNKRPRLHIIFEFEKDEQKFNGKEYYSYDAKKQSRIAAEFKKLVDDNTESERLDFFKNQNSKSVWENLWVIYSSFEPIAKIEANEQIAESQIEQLKSKIGNSELWEVSRAFSGVTFFLHTDEQLKKYENSPEQKHWKELYLEILKEYDEFGYFNNKNFNIYLDSKENFDDNYESNWFYYYK